jgi:iron(III) transport system substrate-binding protein
MQKKALFGGLILVLPVLIGCQSPSSRSLTLYTDRHYEADQLLFDQFSETTGLSINVLKMDADALITRLENEGSSTPADLIFLTDVGRLGRAKEKNLFLPLNPNLFPQTIPSHYMDEDYHWVGLTKRARVIVYDPRTTHVEDLSTYEALSTSDFSIATRSSSHVYNQSLVASLALLHGEEVTRQWLDGLVDRFSIRDPLTQSRQPVGNDRDQAKAVYSGVADLAIMNTYYMGRMLVSSDPLEVDVANALSIFFPNQGTTGTHINLSGIGRSKYSSKEADANEFIQFMLTTTSQRLFADENYEYPIRSDVEPHPVLQAWGSFQEQSINLSAIATASNDAFRWMIEAGWN